MTQGRSTARGRVHTRQGTVYGSVQDSTGKVVWADNTGPLGLPGMIGATIEMVTAVRKIENAGHRLEKSWTELVDD